MTKRVGRAESDNKGVREMNNQMNVGLDSDRAVWEKIGERVGHENRKGHDVVIIEQ